MGLGLQVEIKGLDVQTWVFFWFEVQDACGIEGVEFSV